MCDFDAKITKGYRLPARWVIHTVGPVYRGGRQGEAALLASCHRRALELAAAQGCRTVAFPAISCGVYGYPIADAARIALSAVQEYLSGAPLPEKVRFVLFSSPDLAVFAQVRDELARGSDLTR
jgi:O-acetyl-ADP-ribose deacetylase (regulator of RNase III)